MCRRRDRRCRVRQGPRSGGTAPAATADHPGSAGSADRAGSAGSADRTGSAGSAEGAMHCAPLAFAASTPVPEASAAAWLAIDGKPALLVVSDSGNAGAYGLIDPDTGATTETGKLPLSDDVSDDIEG